MRVLLQEAWQQHRWAQQCQQWLWELLQDKRCQRITKVCIQLDFLLSEAARMDRLERREVCNAHPHRRRPVVAARSH